MKTKTLFAALLLGVSVVACGQSATNNDGFTAPKGQLDSISYLLGINFGSYIKGYDFGNVNYAEVVKGMKDFVNAEGNMNDTNFVKQFKIDPNEMNELFSNYIQKRREYKFTANKEAGEKFLEANKAKTGVQVTESGLQYKIIATGNDKKAGPYDSVLVHYKGTLIDGTVFDESPAGGDPVELSLARVIPGWTEGLQLVGEGGKIELYIPSELAYGEQGAQIIEPNSTLIFDVEVVEVHPASEEEE